MKKIIALLLALVLVLGLVACGNTSTASTEAAEAPAESEPAEAPAEEEAEAPAEEEAEAPAASDSDSDLAYVQGKGTLVVGVTDFAPMDYLESGEWVGFDADMAKAFAESLGVACEIVEINWDTKELELDSKNLDCVWNGMTLTDGTRAAMECSNAYCNNAQVIVVNADVADQYTTAEDFADLMFAVESGSAGEEAAIEQGYNYTSVKAQSDALMEVAAGTSDACIIDLLMAGAMIGEGTSYPNLVHTVELTSEEYGVGFRKGSDLADALNAFLSDAYADGSLLECAKTYGVQDAIIAQ